MIEKYQRNQIIVTGSSGFIGQALVPYLKDKYEVRTISLRDYQEENIELDKVKAIVHLAGLANKMTEIDPNEYFRVNRDLTLRLAEFAKRSAVQHFIYISSTKVYGELGNSYEEQSECLPAEPYGKSKLEAEMGLRELESDLFKVAIIRPPLVYGPKVKGNLNRLMSVIQKYGFVPLGGIKNKRSMVFVGNLVAMIDHVIIHKNTGILLAGDGQPYSTTELVDNIAKGLSSHVTVISLPKSIWSIIGILKPELGKRLFDSLIFDNNETNRRINFIPPYSFEDGVKEMTTHFLSSNS